MKKKFIFFLSILILTGCDEAGVLFPNEISEKTFNYIENKKILKENEKILAYYDVTLTLDNTESAILTDKRVVYHKSNRNNSFIYKNIKNVDHQNDTLIGDIITIESFDGEVMKIEIANWNGGDIFLELLLKKIGKGL